jgi:ATP-dependent Clp protease ATP-binding subunit ClpC
VFERFTERARKVVILAQEEARALKHGHIGTEHLLLGLLCEEEGLAGGVLESFGVALQDVRLQVAHIVGEVDQVIEGQIPFTPRAKKVLELSLRESLAIGNNYIGPEHILLGLVRENQGLAVGILLEYGADEQKVRSRILGMFSDPPRRGQIPIERDWSRVAGPAGTVDDATRALTVGSLLDSVTTAKAAAIESQDFNQAATIGNLERRLTDLLTSIPQAIGLDQSPSSGSQG